MTVSLFALFISQSLTLSSSARHSQFYDYEDFAATRLRLPVACSLTNRLTSLSYEISPQMPGVSSAISASPLGHILICAVIVSLSSLDVFL